MKVLLTCLSVVFLFSGVIATAAELEDFCVVQDSDGYTNVRAKGSLESKVIAKVDHGQIVWIYQGGMTKWPEIIFMDKAGKEQNGYIHASRLKALSDFESVAGKVSEAKQSEVFKKKRLKVDIQLEPFQREGRELIYKDDEFGQRYLVEIDGMDYWGTDGQMPRDQYRKITVKLSGKTIALPDSALKNLFNPGLYPRNTKVVLNPKDDAIYITSFNSDGAGGYLVAFTIQGGAFKSRAVFSPF